ncbi:2,3-diaminopropionate biosynthesis protein SbnA [Streptomyces sp. NPDC059009]|uniref:2,3-diaminopropionate biosynthesis protein SbnA n=1 Tax=Streptomyces sp. NPDC059009 TaxID=3346694 RepID=UPI0036C58314
MSASVDTRTGIAPGILGTIGSTPLIGLDRLSPGRDVKVFAKLEAFNPGGSIKDRVAHSLLAAALHEGELVPGRSTVVESSSGNLAIGLAQLCRFHGLDFIAVVDAHTPRHTLARLRAFGARIEQVCEPDPDSGQYLPSRLRRVRELVATVPGAYWPNQYANPLNPRAHAATFEEVLTAVDGHRVDYLFVATGSCGTLRGCADYIRRHALPTRIVAVDAVGSAIFGSRVACERLIPGHGAAIRPALFHPTDADAVVHVSDVECVRACRALVRSEAIMAGGSSGAVTAAFESFGPRLPSGSVCVLIFPDDGDRYLETIYSDTWVRDTFGADALRESGPAEAVTAP